MVKHKINVLPFHSDLHFDLAIGKRKPYELHAVLEHAAHQELPELALDERRQARPVAGLRRRAQKSLQVLGDDLVEHDVLGVSRTIQGRDTSHASG